MKIGTKLYVFIGGITLITFAVFGFYLNNYISEIISENYSESINEYMDNYTNMIELEIESKKNQNVVGINLANNYLQSLGNINISQDETVRVGNFSLNKWTINGNQIQNNYEIVDKLQDFGVGTATIFQKTPQGYVRVSTNVKEDDGSRAVGTFIGYDSPVVKAIENGQRYLGRARVVGDWFVTAYEPIRINGEIRGIIYVGVPEIDYNAFSEIFKEKSYFGSGYPYIVASEGILTAHPSSVGTDLSEYDFFREMKQEKNGVVTYDWEGREKTQYFRYIDEIDSYITVGWYSEDYDVIFSELRMVVIIATIIGVIAVIVILFIIVNQITRSLTKAVDAAESIAKGEININLDSNRKDETGILLRSMKKMAKNIKGLVTELNNTAEATVEGKLDNRADEDAFEGEYKTIMRGFNGTLDAVIGPLNVTAEYVDRISKGDIPPKITDDYKGDFNEIKNNLNLCIDSVNLLVTDAKMLANAADEGKLDTRADTSQHNGDFRAIIEGVNGTLDNVIGPLNVAAEYVDRISKGDIPPKITDDYNGDFNEIKNNLNLCIDSVNLLVTDAKMLANAADEGKLDTRADASQHNGEFRAIIEGVNGTLDNVIGPLNVAAEYIDRISKGDIPPKITDDYNGDFNEIKNNLNLCIDSLNNMLSDVDKLIDNMIHAKFRYRSNAEKHNGDFRKLMQGINNTIDRIIDVMDNIAAPIMGIDSDFNITFMNKAGAQLDRKSGKEVEGLKCYNHFKTSHCETQECACFRAQKENATVSAETDAHPGGLDLEINYTGFPIKDDEGNTIGAVEIVMDQTEIKSTLNRIQKISDYQAEETEKIVSNIGKAAKGDFSAEFDLASPDNETQEAYETLKHIVDSVEKFINSVKGLQQDVSTLTDYASQGDLSKRADASVHSGEFQKLVQGLNNILDNILEPVNEAGEVLEIMATGDLRTRMKGDYKGDNEKLKNNINLLGNSLSHLIMQVNESVHNSASSASEISATSDSLAASTQEQSAQADEVASAVEEMSRTVTDNAQSANKTSEMAISNGDVAKEGAGVVEQTVTKMRDIADVVKNSAGSIQKLGDSSKKIGEIISVIDDIADQTNLLALNAAIEAARAGEQGRGFAVVADEVRKLAERTTEATKQIADMIKGIQKETESAVVAMNEGTNEVNSGIELADKAGISLNKILESTQEVIDMISQIAAASEEQSATSEQISKNVVSISKVTSESAQRVEDVSKTANELARATEDLSILMQKFKINETAEMLESKDDLRINSSRGKSRHLPSPDDH